MINPAKGNWRALIIMLAALLSTMVIFAQTPSDTSAVSIKGGGFEDGASANWEQESLTDNLLIQQVGLENAHDGRYVARMGGTKKTVDTLDQFLGSWPAYYQGMSLSFFCTTEKASKNHADTDSLTVLLVDFNTGQEYLLGTVRPPIDEWTSFTFPISPYELNLVKGADYFLRFRADIDGKGKAAFFDIDDVSVSKTRNEIWADEPPDTLPDEDGDVPYDNSPGYLVLSITPHRDVPNTCSCGYPSHINVTITTAGYNASDLANAVVKFKRPTASGAKAAAIVSTNYDSNTGYGTIVCTVPDAPGGKNYLGKAQVKVKAGSHKKAWAPHYTCDDNGLETGFFYGFPNPVRNVVLLSSATPNIIGGEPFSVSADGLAVFTHYRPNASPPRCGDRVDKDYEYPVIFAKAVHTGLKVRVKRSALSNVCGSQVWTSYWTGDGAPAVCTDSTPCIATSTPLDLLLLNADNINDLTDSHGYPQSVYHYYKGIVQSALSFAPPINQPAFAPGNNYGPANSVGYGTDSNGNPINIAIRPLQSADNQMMFHGNYLFRISVIKGDDGQNWSAREFSGPTYLDSGWGSKFSAAAPAHAATSQAVPYLATMDDPTQNPTRPGVPFTVVPSFAQAPGHPASTCLENGSGYGCPLSYAVGQSGGVEDVEYFMVGPGDAPQVNVSGCSGGEMCNGYNLSASVVGVGSGGQGRTIYKLHLSFSSTASTGTSVNYTVTVQLSGYGTIETRNVNLYR